MVSTLQYVVPEGEDAAVSYDRACRIAADYQIENNRLRAENEQLERSNKLACGMDLRLKRVLAENERLKSDIAEWVDVNTELLAENERLRAALVPFADAYEEGCAVTSDDMRAAHALIGPADVRTVRRT